MAALLKTTLSGYENIIICFNLTSISYVRDIAYIFYTYVCLPTLRWLRASQSRVTNRMWTLVSHPDCPHTQTSSLMSTTAPEWQTDSRGPRYRQCPTLKPRAVHHAAVFGVSGVRTGWYHKDAQEDFAVPSELWIYMRRLQWNYCQRQMAFTLKSPK